MSDKIGKESIEEKILKRNKASKVIKVTRNTEDSNDQGYDIQDPIDLKQFVRKDPTDLKYYCTICSSFYETSITKTRNHAESSHFQKMFTYHCDQCDGKEIQKGEFRMWSVKRYV